MLNRHNLAIAALASKEESRFTLNALHVTPDYTAETDGHQLVKVTRPKLAVSSSSFPEIPGQPLATDDFKPFLLPAADARELAKSLPKKSTIPILQCAAIAQVEEPIGDGEETKLRTTVMTTDLSSAKFVRPDMPGNFPDIDRVIPNPNKATFAICLDAAILKNLMAQVESFVTAQAAHGKRAPVRFYFQDDKAAIRFDCEGGDDQHMTGVLMPMRADYGTYSEIYRCENCRKDAFELRDAKYYDVPCCVQEDLDEPEPAPMNLSVELVPEIIVPDVSLAPAASHEHPLGCECGTCMPVAGDSPSTPEWKSAPPVYESWKEAADANSGRQIGKPESDPDAPLEQPNPVPDSDLLTAADVAKVLGIHQGTVYTLVKNKRIPAPAHTIGRAKAWMRSEIPTPQVSA